MYKRNIEKLKQRNSVAEVELDMTFSNVNGERNILQSDIVASHSRVDQQVNTKCFHSLSDYNKETGQ